MDGWMDRWIEKNGYFNNLKHLLLDGRNTV